MRILTEVKILKKETLVSHTVVLKKLKIPKFSYWEKRKPEVFWKSA